MISLLASLSQQPPSGSSTQPAAPCLRRVVRVSLTIGLCPGHHHILGYNFINHSFSPLLPSTRSIAIPTITTITTTATNKLWSRENRVWRQVLLHNALFPAVMHTRMKHLETRNLFLLIT